VKLGRPIGLACAALLAATIGVAAVVASGTEPTSIKVPHIPPARPAASVDRAVLMLARQDGRRVVALSLRRAGTAARATVTVLDPEGRPVNGLAVRIDGGIDARPCGRGCYRALVPGAASGGRLRVHVRGQGVRAFMTFHLPGHWPVPARNLLGRAERALRNAGTLAYRDRLESSSGHTLTTSWHVVAPDRLSYDIDNGTSAVIVGRWRWDRPAGSTRWVGSRQEPRLALPALPWGTHVQNVYRLNPPAGRRGKFVRLSLYDPSTPAWYEVTLDARSFHIRSVQMVAPSHFMLDDYAAYDLPLRIAAPHGRHEGRRRT
jgi:hypothetical protein